MALKEMTYDEWIEKYKPIQNTITNREEYNGWMFETYDEDDAYIREYAQKHPHNVWTVLTGTSERGDVIVQGWHYVDRYCYFITENPFDEKDEVEVYYEEDEN
jgi:hypothetical protein